MKEVASDEGGTNAIGGLLFGLLVGIALVATSMGVNALFRRESHRLWMIDAGYMVVVFAVMGLILGAWQ